MRQHHTHHSFLFFLSLVFRYRHGMVIFSGCFGFGIDEHIDLGIKYDPSTGIYGMDFFVVLSRPGRRVGNRKSRQSRVGKGHRITQDQAIEWFKKTYEGFVTSK